MLKARRSKKAKRVEKVKTVKRIKSQQGNVMLGAIFLIAIISVITLSYYKREAWVAKQNQAKSLGSAFAMVINALENRLSFDEHFGSGQYDLKALLPTSCGGSAPSDYLPCGFTLSSPLLHGNFVINVSQSTTNPEVRTANVTLGTIGLIENATVVAVPYLAGAVVGSAKSTEPLSGNKYLSAVVSYDLNKSTAVVTAKVVANQNNSNVYLKTDGSNNMENALSFNKNLHASNRMIKYVSELTNDQDLKIDASKVYLGNQSGQKGNSNVVVNDLTIHSMGDKKLSNLLISVPVGSVLPYAGTVIPENYMECDGRYLSRSQYSALFNAIGTTYGASGSSFRLPDLRGVFIRGWDHGKGVDKNRALGTFQDDAIRNITGYLTGGDDAWRGEGAFYRKSTRYGNIHIQNEEGSYYTYFDASRVVPTAADNRPKNVSLMYIIRYQ